MHPRITRVDAGRVRIAYRDDHGRQRTREFNVEDSDGRVVERFADGSARVARTRLTEGGVGDVLYCRHPSHLYATIRREWQDRIHALNLGRSGD